MSVLRAIALVAACAGLVAMLGCGGSNNNSLLQNVTERASWSLVQTGNPTRSAEDHQVELDAAISAIRSREAQAKAS